MANVVRKHSISSELAQKMVDLVQNTPDAKLILYPDANHGSWYEYHEDFVFETNRFLGGKHG